MTEIFQLADPAGMRRCQWQGTLPPAHIGRDRMLWTQFATEQAWGVDTALDLFDGDPVALRDAATIKALSMALGDQIQLRRSGEPLLVHGDPDERGSGFWLVQLLETSAM